MNELNWMEEKKSMEEVPYINQVFSTDHISPLLPSPPIGKESFLLPSRSSSISGTQASSWHPLWNNGDSIWKTDEDSVVRQRSNSMIPYTTAAALEDYFQPRKGLQKRHSMVSTEYDFVYRQEGTYRPPTPPFQEPVVINPTSVSANVQQLGKGTPIHQVKSNEIYQVQFKLNRNDYFYLNKHENIKVNDYVVVEGDRGFDMGKVIDIVEKRKVTDKYIKQLYCKASNVEIDNYLTKEQEEQKALAICQWKIKQKNLKMKVIDAEYQWDRRKLTFYFHASERIDFRDLVRELFKIYKTRIWMSCA